MSRKRSGTNDGHNTHDTLVSEMSFTHFHELFKKYLDVATEQHPDRDIRLRGLNQEAAKTPTGAGAIIDAGQSPELQLGSYAIHGETVSLEYPKGSHIDQSVRAMYEDKMRDSRRQALSVIGKGALFTAAGAAVFAGNWPGASLPPSPPPRNNLVISLFNPYDAFDFRNDSYVGEVNSVKNDPSVGKFGHATTLEDIRADAPDAIISDIRKAVREHVGKHGIIDSLVIAGHGNTNIFAFTSDTIIAQTGKDVQAGKQPDMYNHTAVSTSDLVDGLITLKNEMNVQKPICRRLVLGGCNEFANLDTYQVTAYRAMAHNLGAEIVGAFSLVYSEGTKISGCFVRFNPDGMVTTDQINDPNDYKRDYGTCDTNPKCTDRENINNHSAWFRKLISDGLDKPIFTPTPTPSPTKKPTPVRTPRQP